MNGDQRCAVWLGFMFLTGALALFGLIGFGTDEGAKAKQEAYRAAQEAIKSGGTVIVIPK